MVVVAVEAAAAATMATRFSVFNLLPQMKTRRIIPLSSSSSKDLLRASAGLPNKSFNPVLLPNTSPPQQKQHSITVQTTLSAAASLTLPFFLNPPESLAGGGEFGILEGRSFALVHPIVMSGLFFYTLYAGYLGWQWRRVRTLQDEINELKKQILPAQQLVTVPDDATATRSSPPSAVETKIQGLTEERKNLIKGSFRDRHFNAGSLLLGFGVLEAVGGCLNTWLRTGKLFPGPHLFAGAGITVLWAAAAALVPAMQKGDETARSLHIALNTVNVLLFIWQIPTGFDIVLKVFEFTKWP